MFGVTNSNFGTQGWFQGSPREGASNCAIDTNNEFPSPAQIAMGTNTIPLAQLTPGVDGNCKSGATFHDIDIHVQGYTCAGNIDATLSNVSFQ
jgi:hypothetical protein